MFAITGNNCMSLGTPLIVTTINTTKYNIAQWRGPLVIVNCSQEWMCGFIVVRLYVSVQQTVQVYPCLRPHRSCDPEQEETSIDKGWMNTYIIHEAKEENNRLDCYLYTVQKFKSKHLRRLRGALVKLGTPVKAKQSTGHFIYRIVYHACLKCFYITMF